jgi:hypothetical protein
MRVIEVGQAFSDQPGPLTPGVQLSISGATPELHLILDNLTQAEVEAVRAGPARFGVYQFKQVLFFLYRFDPATPWSDTPYHIALERPYRKVNLQLLTEQSRALLTVYLVSAENGIVRVIRALSLNPETTRALWQAVLLQDPDKIPEYYDNDLQQVYARLNSAQMAQEGVVSKGGE